jgi:hypothetical protein
MSRWVSGYKDNRYRRRSFVAANQSRGLEAVHSGHLYVEKNNREVVAQHAGKRLLTRRSLDNLHPKVREAGFHREKIAFAIIDRQNHWNTACTIHPTNPHDWKKSVRASLKQPPFP